MIREAVKEIIHGRDLSGEEAEQVMMEVMRGEASPVQLASLLTALKMKGETVDEITAFAKVMRRLAKKINVSDERIVDTCGTGGGKIKTFNVSTTAAFIAAGCGVKVAKHGNRAVTSKSGSADVLENLGVNIHLSPEDVRRCIRKIGIAFIFAPEYHPAMKYAALTRRELAFKTVFNVLGPLTNPCNTKYQLVGVYKPSLVVPVAYALRNLECSEAFVVHGLDGLDEISTVGKTLIAYLKSGKITVFETKPTDFNIKQAKPESLTVDNRVKSAETVFKILYGCFPEGNPVRDFAVINAAAAIVIGGKAENFAEGVELANKSIDSGKAYAKLRTLIEEYGVVDKIETFEEKHRRLLRSAI